MVMAIASSPLTTFSGSAYTSVPQRTPNLDALQDLFPRIEFSRTPEAETELLLKFVFVASILRPSLAVQRVFIER